MTAPNVPPAAPPVDGEMLLNEVRAWLAVYICTVDEADLDLLTLWAAHTHLVNETYTTPRLQIDSPVPENGKTTCLEHLQRLCLRPVQMASLASPALLTRMLDVEMRTILIDEADRSLNPDKEGIAELLAVINSGYKRGGTRPVLVPGPGGKWVVDEMPIFAPVAMAGNNPNLPDDTRSRTLRVLLLPDLDGTVDESDWELIEQDAQALHNQLADWADQVRDQVRTERPGLPDGIFGRFREKWSPLKRVAAAAGGRWPAAVDEMALHDKKQYAMDKEDGLIREKPAVLLLKHIHELWPTDAQFWPTSDLVDLLAWSHPTVWGPEGPFGKKLTVQRLGKMLVQGYKINSIEKVTVCRAAISVLRSTACGTGWESTPPKKPVQPVKAVKPVSLSRILNRSHRNNRMNRLLREGSGNRIHRPRRTGTGAANDCGDPVGSGIARCRPCFNKATAP